MNYLTDILLREEEFIVKYTKITGGQETKKLIYEIYERPGKDYLVYKLKPGQMNNDKSKPEVINLDKKRKYLKPEDYTNYFENKD